MESANPKNETAQAKQQREIAERQAFIRWLYTRTGNRTGVHFDAYEYGPVSGFSHHYIRGIANPLKRFGILDFPGPLRPSEQDEFDHPEKGDVAGADSADYPVVLLPKGAESAATAIKREEADKRRADETAKWKQEVEADTKAGILDRQPAPVSGVGSDEINALITAENRLLAWVHFEQRHKVNTDDRDGAVQIDPYALICGMAVEDVLLIGRRLEKRGFLEARNRTWVGFGRSRDIFERPPEYRYIVTEKGLAELARLEGEEKAAAKRRRLKKLAAWGGIGVGAVGGLAKLLTDWHTIVDSVAGLFHKGK